MVLPETHTSNTRNGDQLQIHLIQLSLSYLTGHSGFPIFYLIGGIPLAVALFGGAFLQAVGVRTFNYEDMEKGKDKEEGMDFNE